MPNRSTVGQPRVSQVKAELFRVLGHPVRVRILELLRDGERTVGDLQQALGLDASSTSQHLGALRNRDVVVARREGKNVYYAHQGPPYDRAARGRPEAHHHEHRGFPEPARAAG